MANTVDDIMDIIEKSHKIKIVKARKKLKKMFANDSLDGIKNDLQEFFINSRCNISSIEYASLRKLLAMCNLQVGSDIDAINNLVEAHAVILRQQVLHRHIKTEMRQTIFNLPQPCGLSSKHANFSFTNLKNNNMLITKLKHLPEEWYMIQISGQFVSESKWTCMHPIHITILPTGPSIVQPFCITIPKPKTDSSYDVCSEIQTILHTNKSDLEARYRNHDSYWKMREKQNLRMKTAMQHLESVWLREWRILFMADLIENLELERMLVQMIDKLIVDSHSSEVISNRTKWLLKKIALGASFLTRAEIARAVKYVLLDHEKLAGNIILSIYGQLTCINSLQSTKRKTLILIVDEYMDYIPFESMEILKSHPVTRFPSVHIAYALFKEHETTIHGGCKVIKNNNNLGTCIVNPCGTLMKMEKRMKLFIKYWLPQWNALYNVHPTEEQFENVLVNKDILMYNGHGSGIRYLPGERIEKLRVRSIGLLFGCSSVKLLCVGGRYPPDGISNQYLIASSPCLVGMLWEVTDADIDKMTADFISNWIPSCAKKPWNTVDATMWCTGKLS